MKTSPQIDLHLVGLCLLALLIFFPALGSRDFWAPVEPRYGEIARVMFANREWIVPKVNGQLYTDKPILYFWCVLIFSKLLGGVSEWSVRLPAAFGALGTVLATYSIGKYFFGRRTGFIAAAVLATSARAMWEGRWAHVDMLFMFFFTAAMLFGARAISGDKRRMVIVLAAAAMALAVLTKGLIGIVLPGLIIGSFILIRRDWRLLSNLQIPLGVAVFLIIAAPWFFAVDRATGGQWLRDFIYIHHIQRYTDGAGHREPFYYYCKTLPLDFLPWTLLTVPALFRRRNISKPPAEPLNLFLLLWFGMVFLFFSFSDTKRDLYLLPLFPPLCLWLARYLDEARDNPNSAGAMWRGILCVVFSLLVVGFFGLPVAARFIRPESFPALLPVAMITGLCSFCVAWFSWRGSLRGAFGSIIATMTAGVVSSAVWFLPFLEQYKSPRPVAAEIKRYVAPAEAVYIYADTMNDFNFYAGREILPVIPSPSELGELRARDPNAYLLIKERDMQRVAFNPPPEIVARRGTVGRMWYLLRLR